MAPSSKSQHFNELQIRYALGPWLPAGADSLEELRDALGKLNVADLQGVRREANKRLVPDKVLSGLLEAAHREGRLAQIPAPPSGASWPFPEDEAGLLALAERILELEELQELMRVDCPDESDLQPAVQELLELGVGNTRLLLQRPTNEIFKSAALQGRQMRRLLQRAVLLSSETEEEAMARRSELQRFGEAPLLVTAPHNAFLRRDGHPLHSLEEYTTILARGMAREGGGAVLCWSRGAQWRTELRYSLGHRRKAMGLIAAVAEELDPANRDPNFLLPQELDDNAWHGKMREWALGRAGHVALHIDVHGCQDPPKHPAHAMLGLGGMRQHAEAMPEGVPERERVLRRMRLFARCLETHVAAALAPIVGLPASQVVAMTGLAPALNEKGEHVETLSGAWPPEIGRLTQTQQSVYHCGVSHAVQLELSRTLRHGLMKSPAAVVRLARAIQTSWKRALEMEKSQG